jgi:protein-tyrosine-phosphatase
MGENMPSLLFVCTRNICRSPMAVALMRKRLKALSGSDPWHVDSAGTWTRDGLPASKYAVEVIAERKTGDDLRSHRSKQVSEELLVAFDLILTMERGHKEALQVEFPAVAERVYLLSEMIGEAWDVEEPFGESIKIYREAAQTIDDILNRGIDRIVELVGAG